MYNGVANGSRHFFVIGGHFERGQVARWRSGENKRRAGFGLPTKMTANDDGSRTRADDEVKRKPVWKDYAKVQ